MLRSLVLAAAVLVAAPRATAQWSADPAVNLTIAARPAGQVQPKIVESLNGSYYVSWLGGGADGYDVYLQRLDYGGVPQWIQGGVRVADRGYTSTQDYGLDVNESGTAFVAFRMEMGGTSQVGLSRVERNGSVTWEARIVSSDPDGANSPRVAAVRGGGAVVAWTSGNGALRLQRVDAAGTPEWGPEGVTIVPPSGTFFLGGLHADLDGNVIVSGQAQLSFASRQLWMQKLSTTGTPLWGSAPLAVFDGTTGALQFGYFPDFTPDGAGGAFVAWYAVSGVSGSQAYVQHVLGDGTLAFGPNGVAVATDASRVRFSPSLAYNALPPSALYVAWPEESASPPRRFGVSVQQISETGARLWGEFGQQVVPLGTEQTSQVRADPLWIGTLVAWAEGAAPSPMTLYAQGFVSANGPMWDPLAFKTAPTSVSRLHSSAGAYEVLQVAFAWSDGEPGTVKGQTVTWNGTLTNPGPTPSVAAGPDAQATLAVAPHPVVGATTIRVTLVQPAAVRLEVLDALGRRVAVLANAAFGAGDHALPWDATGLAPGVYLAQLSVGDATTARRVVVAR